MRLAIVSALEALEVGDQALACDILLAALEDGDTVGASFNRCPACGNTYEWPGLLERHLLTVHGTASEELPRAA